MIETELGIPRGRCRSERSIIERRQRSHKIPDVAKASVRTLYSITE
jgi:hypothetical protein